MGNEFGAEACMETPPDTFECKMASGSIYVVIAKQEKRCLFLATQSCVRDTSKCNLKYKRLKMLRCFALSFLVLVPNLRPLHESSKEEWKGNTATAVFSIFQSMRDQIWPITMPDSKVKTVDEKTFCNNIALSFWLYRTLTDKWFNIDTSHL